MQSAVGGTALSTAGCWAVLENACIGRLLYTFNALPAVQVVRIAVRDRLIIFSVDAVSASRVMRDGFTFGALQADEVVADGGVCQSVVVLGTGGLVAVEDIPFLSTLGLPTNGAGVVYGFVDPVVLEGMVVDVRSETVPR